MDVTSDRHIEIDELVHDGTDDPTLADRLAAEVDPATAQLVARTIREALGSSAYPTTSG